jgi:UDP-N-acetylmuramate--alanine ligase
MKIFEHNNYHFIGIGGIGVSAIARMLFLQGKNVTGSDSGQSEITDDLEKLGIKVSIGQKKENLAASTEVVIYSIAIKEDNLEILEAKKRGVVCISYPQFLGELSREMFTIAISGTHGKTTTTAMFGHILQKAGLDPTVVVGSKILGENTNFLSGKSKYLAVEACEYRRSFLNLSPSILVITNIEADHLDYYKDLADIQTAFEEMANKVPENGFIITQSQNENIKKVLRKTKAKILDYNSVIIDKEIGVAGEHNILDAKTAIKAASALGIDEKVALDYLKDFKGTWRRLEYKGEKEGNIFYDDYAHHPTEIKASLSALKEKHPDRKIICVFEPHQQSRTKSFFDDFVKALKLADEVFVAPILITRETDDGETTNKTLADAVNKFIPAIAIENPDELLRLISEQKKPLCIVLMGAGNIYKWTQQILHASPIML